MKSHDTRFVSLDPRRCKACWHCVETCPRKVIGKVKVLWHRHARFANSAACTGCMKCIKACPHGALSGRSELSTQSPQQGCRPIAVYKKSFL